MNKFDFTPEGVQALVTSLYALPDTELQPIADAAEEDFAAWLRQYFNLTTSQDAFLDALSPDYIADSGADTRFALMHRLPITLAKPEPSGMQPRTDKYIRRKKNTTGTANANGDYTVTGDLAYEIIE